MRGIIFQCDVNQLQTKFNAFLGRTAVFISPYIGVAVKELVNKITMSPMQLYSVEPSLKGVLNTLFILLFSGFDVLQSHLLWDRIIDARNVSNRFSDSDCRRSPRFKSFHFIGMRHPAAMNQLNKNLASFCMNSLVDFLPAFHLSLIIKTRCSFKSSASKAPRGGFRENESCTCSLLIVLCDKRSRYTQFWIAPLASECSHYDSVIESEISHGQFVAPFEIHDLKVEYIFYRVQYYQVNCFLLMQAMF